jgi:hypothetical protein
MPTAYWNKNGNQALTAGEIAAHKLDMTKMEPLYKREVLVAVAHQMAVAMSGQLSNGVTVAYNYDVIVDEAIANVEGSEHE